MPTTIEIEQDTFDIPATVAVPLSPPGKSASTDEKVDFVQQQLDGFGLDVPVLGDLLMLGHGDCQRRHGGACFCLSIPCLNEQLHVLFSACRLEKGTWFTPDFCKIVLRELIILLYGDRQRRHEDACVLLSVPSTCLNIWL